MRPAERAAARALVVNCAKCSHHGSGPLPLRNIAMSNMRLMCSCAAMLVEAKGGRINRITDMGPLKGPLFERYFSKYDT